MKSFNKFINEAKKDLPPNPGELTASEFEAFKRVPTTGEKPDTSSTTVDTTSRRTRSRIHRTGDCWYFNQNNLNLVRKIVRESADGGGFDLVGGQATHPVDKESNS